jgi:hypothetical protein
MQEKLREKIVGKWWWDMVQHNREEHFRTANIFDILEKIEEDQVKFNRQPAKEEVNDYQNSTLKGLPSEQHGSTFDPNDPDKQEREAKQEKEAADREKYDAERAEKFRENAFLQTLKAQQAKPPSQQDSLKGWTDPKGPGREGYHVGIKKDWGDAPRVMNVPGRGRVVVGF